MEKIPKGFTLIELLVVITIVIILASAASPSLNDFITKVHLENAAKRIFSDLRFAQSKSLSSIDTIYVTFTGKGKSWCYGLSENETCNCTKKSSCTVRDKRIVVDDTVFSNIELQSARFARKKNYTAFSRRNGRAVADGVKNGTVWLKKNDMQIAIIVNRLGRIRFCSPTIAGYSKKCPKVPKN